MGSEVFGTIWHIFWRIAKLSMIKPPLALFLMIRKIIENISPDRIERKLQNDAEFFFKSHVNLHVFRMQHFRIQATGGINNNNILL